jgi:hypothetical protein
MAERLISALAWYGPKTGALRELLVRVQDLVAGQIGAAFRPYTLEQVHATLIALDGVADPESGAVVNEAFWLNLGVRAEMDLPRVMSVLEQRFRVPPTVRFGGFGAGATVPFLSRGQHLSERSFSVQGNAFVLMGWPAVSLLGPGSAVSGAARPAVQARPLDELRREVNAAGVLHRYHFGYEDVDNDLHLVVGHTDDAPPEARAAATAAVRTWLADNPVEVAIALDDVAIVASDSRTMAPPLYVSAIPADEAVLLGLMRSAPVRGR